MKTKFNFLLTLVLARCCDLTVYLYLLLLLADFVVSHNTYQVKTQLSVFDL